MTKRIAKIGTLALAGGMMMGWLGCLGGSGWWGYIVRDAALAAGYEFLWDNDSILDLFPDEAVAATNDNTAG